MRLTQALKRQESPEGGPAAPWLFGVWALVCILWLALAFAPSEGGQAWLKTLQAVCFGTQDNGLPTAWGWGILILAPLSMLAGLVAAYASDLMAWARARRGPALALLIGFAALLGIESAWIAFKVDRASEIFDAFENAPEQEPLPEHYPRGFEAFPAFGLQDQHGRLTRDGAFAGAPSVVAFIYAGCATVCPFLVRDTLSAVGSVKGAKAVFITLDPWRDTPLALPGIARRYGMGEESVLLSGDPSKVAGLLKRLGIDSLRDPLTGEIQHPPLMLVLDAQGRIAYRFNRPSVPWLKSALIRLQKEP
jgi:cytochrome oxidase Cu insertion factor (SCO1/SenC/PrrC family)